MMVGSEEFFALLRAMQSLLGAFPYTPHYDVMRGDVSEALQCMLGNEPVPELIVAAIYDWSGTLLLEFGELVEAVKGDVKCVS